MSDKTKNPENEAENPAPMPHAQQGQGDAPHPNDPEGHQGGHKARMAVPKSAPPGLETDGQANVIPLSQRTREDQEKARPKSR